MYDYSNVYQIPRRMAKREGIFGQIKTSDGVATAILIGLALLLMLIAPCLITIVVSLCLALFGYFFFILYDKYGENFKIKLLRMIEYNKKQKIYFYYRGTR